MSLVATLISNPSTAALSATANMAADALGASQLDWLAPEIACDIAVPAGLGRNAAERILHRTVEDQPVDIVVQETDERRKKMLIADMDSTMIEQECIDELADVLGLKERVAAITARAMNGEIAFEPALRERVALLEGLDHAIIEKVISERISLMPGGKELVATMNAAGAYTILVSGGFDVFAGPIAQRLGFHEFRANRLLEKNGRLTGRVAEPILGRQAKAEALNSVAAQHNIQHSEVLAVGDGANDLDMLQLAGSGVALHAKPSVASQARIRVDHGDLTALLYLQGYRREEFAIA